MLPKRRVEVSSAFSCKEPGGSPAAAYVFRRDDGGEDNWGEVKKLTASDAQTGDWFG